MTDSEFGYRAIVKPDTPHLVTSLIAYRVPADGPFEAVIWSVPRKAWIYAPQLAVRFVFDDEYQDKSRAVERADAEQLARDTLHADLPTEAALAAMIDEGDRMGWDYGPPRQ